MAWLSAFSKPALHFAMPTSGRNEGAPSKPYHQANRDPPPTVKVNVELVCGNTYIGNYHEYCNEVENDSTIGRVHRATILIIAKQHDNWEYDKRQPPDVSTGKPSEATGKNALEKKGNQFAVPFSSQNERYCKITAASLRRSSITRSR